MFDESKEALIKRIENSRTKLLRAGNIKVNHISTDRTVDNSNDNNEIIIE